ncbi:MAG: AbgT family transporter [Desulfobulbaceae bacterium]|nr:AbgT family transporter [Desulfobulbaceae bacterium]
MTKKEGTKRDFIGNFLLIVEKLGNALPHPATLFALLAIAVVIMSWLASLIGFNANHPSTGELIEPVNLLSEQGIHMIITKMVTNFTSFAPLGTVLVAMLGIGIAESSGLIGTSLRLLVLSSPRKLLTFVIILAGIISNTASEVGYVLLVPLGGIIFHAIGRHPIGGIAAAFAGVSGGYSANLLLGTIDPLLAGLSEEAARIIDPSYTVNPASNYYFLVASVPLIALAGTWVTEKIVMPRLGDYEGSTEKEELRKLTQSEKKGLNYAIIASVIFAAILAIGVVPEDGFLRGDIDPETGVRSVLRSPFMRGIVAFIFLGASFAGISYGIGAKTIKSDSDVMRGMGKSMETLGLYIVLTFFAAQFVAYFNWTNLGKIFAVEGALVLQSSGLGPIPLILAFIALTSVMNLVMGSASAKWALMAPIFIPMFMLLGYSPEFVQAAYRVGDSVSNIISPMMSYFALIVAFFAKYDKKAGIGTIVSVMLPYTFVFFIVWSIFMILWILLGLPVGPDAPLFIDQP